MRQLTASAVNQLTAEASSDPMLVLLTIDHTSIDPFYLVNDTVNLVSRGNTYLAFPFKIILPDDADDESTKVCKIEIDNTTLELITALRSITEQLDAKLELVLASSPDTVVMSLPDLKLTSITYNKSTISCILNQEDFLSLEVGVESYVPSVFPGLFN